MHLVWDWNGTLLDDLDLVVAATNAAFAEVGRRSRSTADEHRRRFRRPIIEFYAESLGRDLLETEFAGAGPDLPRRVPDSPDPVSRWPPTRGRRSRAWTGTQSLLSMWFHDELVPAVDPVRARTSSGSTGCGTALGGTYKADHLKSHLAELGLVGADVVLIGDSVDDADAAEAVGARCVLYTGGFTDAENLRACGVPVADTLVEAVALAA